MLKGLLSTASPTKMNESAKVGGWGAPLINLKGNEFNLFEEKLNLYKNTSNMIY